MKPLEEQTFTDDFMFGWIILSYPDLAREMLERILHIKVGEITYSESQKTVESFANSKGVRFDFYAENSERIIEVEMQVMPDKEIMRRSRYYQAAMDMAQLGTGKHYDELKDTYVVFICLKDPRASGIPVYTVERVCKENASVDVSNGTHEVYLNASAYEREKDVALRALLRYISTNEATDDLTQALDKGIAVQKKREEVIRMFCEIDSPVYIARNEGRNEGIAWQKAQSQAQIDRMASDNARMASAMEQMAAEIAALKANATRPSKS